MKCPHIGWSSQVYPLEVADVAALSDYAGAAIPDVALPKDEIIVYIRPDGPDVLLRGRALVMARAAEGPRAIVRVRFVFKPKAAKWNLLACWVRVIRDQYRYHGTALYHITPQAVRELGLERTIRSATNPQKRAGRDRVADMRKLRESLRTKGFDDARPIHVTFCRSWGTQDSLRQGHHRVSACLDCGIDRMAVFFSAAGALPRVLGGHRA